MGYLWHVFTAMTSTLEYSIPQVHSWGIGIYLHCEMSEARGRARTCGGTRDVGVTDKNKTQIIKYNRYIPTEGITEALQEKRSITLV